MPKATMEYTLPDEQGEFDLARKAGAYHSALWDFYQWLRNRRKHGEPKKDGADELEAVWEGFWLCVNDAEQGLLDE